MGACSRRSSTANPERVAEIRSDLPIYIAVGELDPVNAGLAPVNELVARYDRAGISDVTSLVR